MADTLFISEFRQACSAKGCPFCSLAQLKTRRYVSRLLYEYVTASDVHRRMAASRGLCNRHAWLLQHIAHAEEKDGLGVAILYETVLRKVIDDLDAVVRGNDGGSRGRRAKPAARAAEMIEPTGACLVCRQQIDGEQITIRLFLDDLDEGGQASPLAQAYTQSAGACLPHFDALLGARPSETTALWLIACQRDRLTDMASQLEMYVRKHDVQHRHEPMGAERDSWVRAVELCAGKRDVPIGAANAGPSADVGR